MGNLKHFKKIKKNSRKLWKIPNNLRDSLNKINKNLSHLEKCKILLEIQNNSREFNRILWNLQIFLRILGNSEEFQNNWRKLKDFKTILVLGNSEKFKIILGNPKQFKKI